MSDCDAVRLERLLHVPLAALRSVRWQTDDTGSAQMAHLEVETKHGAVVVFEHADGNLYVDPPRPPESNANRQWCDLTTKIPVAFDGRPTLQQISRLQNPDGWRFDLSTGAYFVFTLHPVAPQIWLNELPNLDGDSR